MTNSAARFPEPASGRDNANDSIGRPVSASDEQAFVEASDRLTAALDQAASGGTHADVAEARQCLREMAVRLRDAGYWQTDKQGLRATVSLLWQADRYVSETALKMSKHDRSAD